MQLFLSTLNGNPLGTLRASRHIITPRPTTTTTIAILGAHINEDELLSCSGKRTFGTCDSVNGFLSIQQ